MELIKELPQIIDQISFFVAKSTATIYHTFYFEEKILALTISLDMYMQL